MTWIRSAGHAGIVAATLFALACGGGDDDGPTGNTGSIQLAVNPAALPVAQGSSGSVTISLTRSGGFSGAVTLGITGLPTGVTTAITPPGLTGTATSASVDVTVAPTVPIGTYTATITAAAPGVSQATTTWELTVTAPPNYTLTVAPDTLTIAAGASGGATITINRTNFTGGVALALLNPPAGITGAFNPTPSTTNTSALTLSVGAAVAPGDYPVTIQGTATGPGVKTTTLTLTVIAAAGTSIEYQFCDASGVPAFFAYQDGAGAWQAVTGTTSGDTTTYTFTLKQGRGGVLMVWQYASASSARRKPGVVGWAVGGSLTPRLVAPGQPLTTNAKRLSQLVDTYETEVVYGSTSELAQEPATCEESEVTKTVTATVAGLAAGEYGLLSLGGSDRIFNGAQPQNPVTFIDVPDGPVDFVASRTRPGAPPDRVIILRNLNIPDGGSLPSVIDFNGPAAVAPATSSVVMSGALGDNLEVYSTLVTANSQVRVWNDLSPNPNTTRPWAGLLPSSMVSGDFYGLVVFASRSPDFRVASKYVATVGPQTVAFGPIMAAPAASQVVGGAYPRFRFQGTLAAEYNKGVFMEVRDEPGEGNAFYILATSAYFASAGNALAYDVTMPDVTALAGFPAGSRLTAGTNTMFMSAFGFTGAGIFDEVPAVGVESRSSTRRSSITVP